MTCLETRRSHVSRVDEQLWLLRVMLVVRMVSGSVLRHLWRPGMAKAMVWILTGFVKHT